MAPSQGCVLLVEDGTMGVLSAALVDAGLSVAVVSGEGALERARAGAQIVVAPSGPDSSGLLRAARERDPTAQLLLTADPGALGPAVAALRQGAFDVLSRPVAPDALSAAVLEALEHRRAARALRAALAAARSGSAGWFLGGVAHELSNPATSLAGALRYAVDSLRDLDRLDALCAGADRQESAASWWCGEGQRVLAEVRGALADAVECSNRVGDLARDLRALSRDELSPRPFSLAGAARAAVRIAAAQLRASAQQVDLDLDDRALVAGSAGALTLALVHLLLNSTQALARSGRRGRVLVRVAAEGATALAEVRDDGPGLAPGELQQAFEPFWSASGETPGLGLAVVRDAVERNGGTVNARSEPGLGATFELRLPLAD